MVAGVCGPTMTANVIGAPISHPPKETPAKSDRRVSIRQNRLLTSEIYIHTLKKFYTKFTPTSIKQHHLPCLAKLLMS